MNEAVPLFSGAAALEGVVGIPRSVFSAECFPTVNEADGQVDCENKLIMARPTAGKIAGEPEKAFGSR